MVSAVTHCAGLPTTLPLALPLVPPQPWECWQWTLVSCRHCFHKATSMKPLESGPRTTVVTHLSLLWELWRQLRPWSSPGRRHMCPQSPQLLRSDPPLPWEHFLLTWMSCMYRSQSSQQRNPLLMMLWGKISVLLLNLPGA